MTTVIIVTKQDQLGEDHGIVGVYSTFDKAVEGMDAHRLWFKSAFEYWAQELVVDTNNTGVSVRYKPFELKAGKVPKYYLRVSAYDERFEGDRK